MAICSGSKHRNRYTSRATLQHELTEIKVVLEAIRLLPIAEPLKKDMLRRAIWNVAFATGNKQGASLGRYRTESVIRHTGQKIERDHVYQMSTLLTELLGPSSDLDQIVARAQCIVVVTADEHRKLSKIDGGEKYRLAGVTVYDMLDETKVVPELMWKAVP